MNLKSISFAAALLSCTVMHGVELPPLSPVDGKDVMGYVHDGAKGVPGVLVSDGYSFARTDENGVYRLASDPAALEVFVILPSGYGYSVSTDGVTDFFRHIERGSEAFRADFALTPIGDDTSFSFLVHADTQPEEAYPTVYGDLTAAYKDMQAEARKMQDADGFTPFNLHLGDIVFNTNTNVRDYGQFLKAVHQAAYNVPTLPTPGNHDRRYLVDYGEAMDTYRSVWGPVHYSFNRGKIHFISVDNVVVEADGDYVRGISPAAMEWLKKDLSYVEKGSRVVFYSHQAMTRSKATRKDYAEVLDILKDYDVLILTGHLHRAFNNFPEYAPTIRERNHAAVCGYFWRGPCSQDGIPNGYYLYSVDGTDISWKFKWIGRDADKNMFRLYSPGLLGAPSYNPSDDKTVIVNVWDWDEDWKVTWSLDGVEQGDVQRYDAAKDPWASYCYDGIKDSWDVKDTYHIFHCDVPASGSVVKVTVSDPFGRTLSKTVTLEADPSGGIEAVAPESCGVASTEIYNLRGVRVLTVEGYPETDTLPLERGCYLLRLCRTDGTVVTEKAII